MSCSERLMGPSASVRMPLCKGWSPTAATTAAMARQRAHVGAAAMAKRRVQVGAAARARQRTQVGAAATAPWRGCAIRRSDRASVRTWLWKRAKASTRHPQNSRLSTAAVGGRPRTPPRALLWQPAQRQRSAEARPYFRSHFRLAAATHPARGRPHGGASTFIELALRIHWCSKFCAGPRCLSPSLHRPPQSTQDLHAPTLLNTFSPRKFITNQYEKAGCWQRVPCWVSEILDVSPATSAERRLLEKVVAHYTVTVAAASTCVAHM